MLDIFECRRGERATCSYHISTGEIIQYRVKIRVQFRIAQLAELRFGNGKLTDQEREVLTWYSLGKSQPEIAIILGVTPHAVKFHLKKIFRKLEVHNDRVAVLKASAMGLITPDE